MRQNLSSKELDPDVEFTPYRRAAVKEIHMRVYFNDNKPSDIANKIIRDLKFNGVDVSDVDKNDLTDLITRYKAEMIKAEDGEPFGNEIFYVESMVYLMTLYDLIKSGHQVFFVFDCFYCNAPKAREDELKEIIGKSIEMNFQDFMANYLG